MLDAAIVRAIPYKDASRIVKVMKSGRLTRDARWNLSLADFSLLRNRAHAFDAIGYEEDTQGLLTGTKGEQTPVVAARISSGLLDVLGVQPLPGRLLRRGDFDPAAPGAALISFQLWTNSFSSDPSVVGRHITVDGKDFTVIGVMPPALRRPISVADLWIPDREARGGGDATAISDEQVVARLRPGVSLASAQRELASLRPVPGPKLGPNEGNMNRFEAFGFVDQLIGPVARILKILLAACLLIQILACLSVGQLLLARRIAKARDLGIQLALGADNRRLSADALLEAAVIAFAGALLSIPLAVLLLRAAAAAAPVALGMEIHPDPSLPLLAYCIGLALASSLVCGAAPVVAFRTLEIRCLVGERWDLGVSSLSIARLQDVLIVAQLSVAVVLMTAFVMLARGIYVLSNVTAGFEPADLSYVMYTSGSTHFPESVLRLHEALRSLSRLPFVQSAAIGSTPILTGARISLAIAIKTDEGAWMDVPAVPIQAVSGGYFSTLGVPLLKGRTFGPADTKGAPCAAIVNRSFARLVWSTDDARKKQIDLSGGLGERAPCEIVGVVGDARDIALASAPEPELFFSDLQKQASGNAVILLRSATPHRSVPVETVNRLVAAADSTRREAFSTDVGALVNRVLSPPEARARLLGALAAGALLLAAGGMYSAAAYGVSRRKREVGIRLALGASRGGIAILLSRHYAKLAVIGALAGTAVSAEACRRLGGGLALIDTESYDPRALALAPAVCVFVVLASVAIAAIRAADVSPSELLRDESA